MQNILLLHNSKWFYPTWALLFTLSLMLIWFCRRKWKKGYDTFFWLIVLSIVTVYCPLLAKAIIPRFLPSYGEYERLTWIFFEIPLLSYVLIILSKTFSKQRNQCLFLVAFLVVFILIGSPDNRNFFQKAQNEYKISPDALSICEKIDSLSPQGPVVLCIQLNHWKSFLSGNGLDGTLYYGIRLFSSRFRLNYYDVSDVMNSSEDFVLPDYLSKDIDYYICPKTEIVYRELERLGYKYVDESENFAIFQNQNKNKDGTGS